MASKKLFKEDSEIKIEMQEGVYLKLTFQFLFYINKFAKDMKMFSKAYIFFLINNRNKLPLQLKI